MFISNLQFPPLFSKKFPDAKASENGGKKMLKEVGSRINGGINYSAKL